MNLREICDREQKVQTNSTVLKSQNLMQPLIPLIEIRYFVLKYFKCARELVKYEINFLVHYNT